MTKLTDLFRTATPEDLISLLNSQIVITDNIRDTILLTIYDSNDYCFSKDCPDWMCSDNIRIPEDLEDCSILFGYDGEIPSLIFISDGFGEFWEAEYAQGLAEEIGVQYQEPVFIGYISEQEQNGIEAWYNYGCLENEIPTLIASTRNCIWCFTNSEALLITLNNQEQDISSLSNIFKNLIENDRLSISGDIFDDFRMIISSSPSAYNSLMQAAAEFGAEIDYDTPCDDILRYLNTNPLLPRLWGAFIKTYKQL